VGGLSNINNHSDSSDYIGYLVSEPETAKRESNVEIIDRTQWAKEQYEILCDSGLTDDDKIYLPYVMGKYGIDMIDNMKILVMNSKMKYICVDLKEMLGILRNCNMKLIVGISSLIGNRAEFYLDRHRSAEKLEDFELLFIPIRNSGFIDFREDNEAFPKNLLWCINTAAQELNFKVNKTREENKVASRFTESIDAIVFSFD
jgi:hypothetical protein